MTDTPATTPRAELPNDAPFHGIIENWLGSVVIQGLLRHVEAHESHFEYSKIESGEIDASRRRSRRLPFTGSLATEFRSKAVVLLPDILDHLRIEPFTPTEVELELAVHGDSDFFSTHVDSDRNASGGRLISAVYYFHRLPKVFSGGNLRVYSHAEDSRKRSVFVEVPPANDTLVFFPSWLPHEVTRITSASRDTGDSRFSINCWFHRN
jgi:SM-20-related protein